MKKKKRNKILGHGKDQALFLVINSTANIPSGRKWGKEAVFRAIAAQKLQRKKKA